MDVRAPRTLATPDAVTLVALRAKRASMFSPVYIGVGATLASATIFFAASIAGFPSPSTATPMFFAASSFLVPFAGVAELVACVSLLHDYSYRGREKYYTAAASAGWALAIFAFLSAVAQFYLAPQSEPDAAAQASKAAIVFGHGAWAATLALVAGSPHSYIEMDVGGEGPVPVVDRVDEKTPLKAISLSTV